MTETDLMSRYIAVERCSRVAESTLTVLLSFILVCHYTCDVKVNWVQFI